MFSNIICIHLRRFKTQEDLENLFQQHGLDTIDSETCFSLMRDGFTKIFIDKNTYKLIGYCHESNRKMIQISEDFISHLRKMDSITIKNPKIKYKLSVDSILDKISELGVESLTEKEKEFLKNNS